MERKLTQIAHEARKVSLKVYGSSGVGVKRKKGYTSACQLCISRRIERT
jgi:hypothetical protein